MSLTPERSEVLDRFFDEPTGRARTSGDAVALAREGLETLEQALSDVGMLDEAVDLAQQGDVEARVYETAVALGRGVLDGLTGMVISDVVTNHVSSRRRGLEREAPPLDDAWQRTDNPAKVLAGLGAAHRERLDALEGHSPTNYSGTATRRWPSLLTLERGLPGLSSVSLSQGNRTNHPGRGTSDRARLNGMPKLRGPKHYQSGRCSKVRCAAGQLPLDRQKGVALKGHGIPDKRAVLGAQVSVARRVEQARSPGTPAVKRV